MAIDSLEKRKSAASSRGGFRGGFVSTSSGGGGGDALEATSQQILSLLTSTYSLVGTALTDIGNLPSLADINSGTDAVLDGNVSIGRILQRQGFTLAQLSGVCANPGTATETYTIILDATTYTITHAGLTSAGGRGTAVLAQT